jgi:hypothetical protein
MYYHAVFYMGGRPHWWANYQLEDFIAEIILPFIEKHVITSTYEHRSSLLNLGATEYLTAYRTNAGVVTKGKSGADEIQAGEVCTDEVLEIARLRAIVCRKSIDFTNAICPTKKSSLCNHEI